MTIYRNYSQDTIPIVFAGISTGEVLEDSQNYDFCPDIINLRNGINDQDWFLINFNHPITPEILVANQNDHPNLVSYSLPMGTYIAFTTDSDQCSKEQYAIFDINTNDAFDLE